MKSKTWESILLPQKEHRNWELYHENSKSSTWHRLTFTEEELDERLMELHISLPVQSRFVKKIDASLDNLKMSLKDAFTQRHSCRNMIPKALSFEELSIVLQSGFGISRPNESPRPLKTTPSAGKLFPLEPYFYTAHTKDIPSGLFHYNMERGEIQLVKDGNHQTELEKAIGQHHFAGDASVLIFLTGVFERTTVKYGERGYRMILLEAGHVAQNINLAVTALGLGCLNIMGFYDRKIEDYLDIDGVNHSILYVIAIGQEQEKSI